MHEILHALGNFFGINSGDSSYATHWYNFWSGFGSDFGELAIFGSLVGLYRHHNCGVQGCPRIGHHEVDGTKYKTCHKHATKSEHKKLFNKHKRDFPAQHELLNNKK